MNNRLKEILMMLCDVLLVNAAILSTFYLHYEGAIPADVIQLYMKNALILTVGKIIIFRYFGLYNSVWEYATLEELVKVALAVSLSAVLSTILLIYRGGNLYFGIYLSMYFFELIFIGVFRASFRLYRSIKSANFFIKNHFEKKILIIGSGATASLIADEIRTHKDSYGEIIGFLDADDKNLNKVISGVKVIGNFHDIGSVVYRFAIDEIIVAVPTVDQGTLRVILEDAKRTSAKVRIAPGIREIIDGQVSLSKIRDVEIEDLLGREAVNLNIREVIDTIEGKVVLVTGGGGSIGSELCRQLARFNPKQLIILDIYENSAYELQQELNSDYGTRLNLDVVIASVTDREAVFSLIDSQKPDVIFHAAAHKHVPLMERTPNEAIKNNVFGTKNVAEAAHKFGVGRFVMISTDKAVNPTNIMGASKRVCEMYIQMMDKQSKTKFTAVRFGNVLGSNGSVVPLFNKQIREGGPVTVTHREIIRYFMTIPEAAQLVLQSGAMAKGGEIFVLDMGKPVKIYDLAVDMIKLSGLKLGEDIEIEIIGLRPGEKLYEELLMDEEGLKTTSHEKIRVGQPLEIDIKEFMDSVEGLRNWLNDIDRERLILEVQKIVPNYRDNCEVNQEKIRQDLEMHDPKTVNGKERMELAELQAK
ncbi:nucleoside-diphosphate sugar epimerase/dehydratase [Eubacteriaceae bacterium ES2]|nr:nucleoside-diphosphate sugar epimerase/dehydratase [Eubacteriaceae bacterium ES2]